MSFEGELGIGEIQRHLPHRFPMLMLDRVVQLEPGRSGTGIKNVTASEYYFQGHFPEAPVLPGVFTIEAIAQLAGVVLSPARGTAEAKEGAAKPPYLLAVVRMKFRRPVVPGDTMVVRAEVTKRFGNMIRVKGEVRVADRLVASGELVVGGGAG